MSVYFIRHPQTTWNLENRLQGSQEGSITKAGKVAVKKFITQCELRKVDYIFHANNQRTKYLAQQLLTKFPKAEISSISDLNERNCGIYEGKLSSQISIVGGGDMNNYQERFNWKPPDGESHKEVFVRVKDFLEDIKKKHQDKVVVSVTSKGVIKLALMIEQNLTLSEMYNLQVDNLQMYLLM